MPAQQSELQRAEQLIAAKDYAQALTLLREHWLANPRDRQAVHLFSRLMKALGKTELSGSLYKLAESDAALEDDVQNLFEAGFKLIDEHELQLAVMLLERCAVKMPGEAVVIYELGFALMSLHRFADAAKYFEKAREISDDFDTKLNLCVCYTMMRDLDKAGALTNELESAASNEEEQAETAHRLMVLRRLELFENKQRMSPRDWLFTLYGSIILHDPAMEDLRKAIRTGVFTGITFDTKDGQADEGNTTYKDVAWTLLVLGKLLTNLGFDFDVIEFYSPLSRPLAEAMGHMMELPIRSFGGEDSTDRALMIMAWAPNIIGPHKSFMTNTKRRVLFAYGLSTLQPLPLTPDVVAELGHDVTMPWAASAEEEQQFYKSDGFDLPDQSQVKAIDRILQEIAELESRPEIIQQVEEIAHYYRPKRDMIVLGNPQQFPQRTEYSAEIML
jgi:tetratricopeptide (TPR) repeat protein